MASFTTIPRELRELIYSHLDLVTFAEIIPYPTPHERDSAQYQDQKVCYPSVALLRVNHKIRTEALAVIFGKNTWRLPSIPLPWVNCHNIFKAWYLKDILSVTVVFDQHDLPSWLKSNISRRIHSQELDIYDRSGTPLYGTPTTRSADIHARYLSEIADEWRKKGDLLSRHTNVQSIVVDLGNLACPSGCCRLQLLGIDGPFYKAFLEDLLPSVLAKAFAQQDRSAPRVTIKGLLNREEEFLIKEVYGFSTS